MGDLFDFIRQNNATKGENMGMAAALQAQAAGQDPTAGTPQTGSQPIAPALAQAAAGTDTNMATGAPIDLAAAQRIYQQNKQMTGAMSDDTEAKLTAAAQAGQFPALYKYLPDDGKKLLDKMQKNGNLGFGDAAKLNGIMTGAMKTVTDLNQQKAQASAIQAQNIANSSAGMQNQLQGATLTPQLEAIQRMQQLSQAQNGTGSGVLSPGAQAMLQSQLRDPSTNLAASYFGMTGQRPTPEMMDKFYTQQRQVKRPIGVVSAGVETSKDSGMPQFDLYNRVNQKGDGSIEPDDNVIKVPYGSAPPAQLLDSNSFQPVSPQTLANKGMSGSNSSVATKPVVMTDAQQKALADANDDLHALNQTSTQLDAMKSAVAQVTGGQTSGGNSNAIWGSKPGRTFLGLIGHQAGNQLEAASGITVPMIMAQTKGIRSQTEFSAATSMKPEPSDSNAVLAAKANYFDQLHQSNVSYAQAYRDNLAKGMSIGQAKQEATKAAPLPSPGLGGPNQGDAGAQAKASPSGGPMPTVTSADEFAALPKGTLYRTPKGSLRVK